MKITLLLLACVGFTTLHAQSVSVPDPNKKIEVVEASCGECQFKMPGKGCHLAVRIKDKSYFVDGTGLDDHGDAHAQDGFCESIKKAEVQGKVVNNRFVVTYFRLVPPPPPPSADKPKTNG